VLADGGCSRLAGLALEAGGDPQVPVAQLPGQHVGDDHLTEEGVRQGDGPVRARSHQMAPGQLVQGVADVGHRRAAAVGEVLLPHRVAGDCETRQDLHCLAIHLPGPGEKDRRQLLRQGRSALPGIVVPLLRIVLRGVRAIDSVLQNRADELFEEERVALGPAHDAVDVDFVDPVPGQRMHVPERMRAVEGL
jgi:hypothetical protein